MRSHPTLLVPLDGNSQSTRVLPYAKRLVGAGGRLELLQIVPHPALEAYATETLHSITEPLLEDEIEVETHVALGDPPAAIVEEASLIGADMIAMATDRWSDFDRWLNDSVADWVLHHTSIPVLLVPAECLPEAWPAVRGPTIAVPLDGSPLSEQALEPAADLARILKSDMVLLCAVESDSASAAFQRYLDELVAKLQTVRALTSVQVGSPESLIQQVTEPLDIGLIVMATRGHSGFDRFTHGSHTTRIRQNATVPLVLVHTLEHSSGEQARYD